MYAAVSAACGGVIISMWAKWHTRQERAVRVLSYQIVKLYCGNSLVDTRDNLLCDRSCVNMVCIEAITQSRDTSCDFVELNALLAAV